VKPKHTVRRFDVFAEYRKQEQEEKGDPDRLAKGYGLWVAKVVASRRSGGAKASGAAGARDAGDGHDGSAHREGEWHLLDGEPQTDVLFDREIVQRLGDGFYHQVLVPAIRRARKEGKSYEQIRDALRKEWNETTKEG
jgi:hypothetical protein